MISISNVKIQMIEFQEESAMAMTVQVLQHVGRMQQMYKHECKFHRYLLVQHPHVSNLPLVVVVQPPQLLAGLLHVVVLPDQLDVVLSHHLQLLFQLGVLAHQTAVQRTEETPQQVTSDCRQPELKSVLQRL